MKITSFRGLNNVSDPMRLGMEWLAQADNINITDTGAITKRQGYTLAQAGAFTSAYSTLDFSRMYVAVGGTIKNFVGTTLAALTSSAPLFWCEANENVYYNNGEDSGVIAPDDSVALWRGAPRSYGAGFKNDEGDDLEVLFDTLPRDTSVIQFWKGRMYAAQYMPSENQTVIWFSEPMGFHLFNLDSNFFMVPGQVLMLAPHDDALIVGTDAKTYAYTEAKLDLLADYGVVAGQHWSRDDERILFWSTRGVCAALPFLNLTEKQVSVAPGVRAGGCVVRDGGQKRYLAVLQQGGLPFNSYI
jgi:hypothetical protein